MSKLVEEEVEVAGEVLVAASSKRIPPPKSWVLLLGVKVTVEAMVDTVLAKKETNVRDDKNVYSYRKETGEPVLLSDINSTDAMLTIE